MKKQIDIVVPCYNEEGNIKILHQEIDKIFSEQLPQYDYSIIFVNDGSSDGSLDILQKMSHEYSNINYLSFSRNFGHQIAVKAGTSARSIFPGVVVNVMANGGAKTVMVKHGEFLTIYSNLVSPSVSKNQNISAGTTVGEVGIDIDGTYSLDFQIWDKTTPVDPLNWINY